MTYTISNGLRDREYNKFQEVQAGSLSAVAVFLASGTSTGVPVNSNNAVKIYSFPIGSITALNAGAVSGGNFHSYTDIPIVGQLKTVEWVAGNNTNGSLAIFVSGGAGLQVWGTITRALNANFAVFPVATAVTTDDKSTISGNTVWYEPICLNNILMVVGSDMGKGKSGLALNIAYI
jgi:hypothetical protein